MCVYSSKAFSARSWLPASWTADDTALHAPLLALESMHRNRSDLHSLRGLKNAAAPSAAFPELPFLVVFHILNALPRESLQPLAQSCKAWRDWLLVWKSHGPRTRAVIEVSFSSALFVLVA